MSTLITMNSSNITIYSVTGEATFNTDNKYLYEDTNNPFWFINGGESIAMDIDSQLYTGVGGGGRFNMKTNFNGTCVSVNYSTYSYNSVWYKDNYNKNTDTTGVFCYYKKFGVL